MASKKGKQKVEQVEGILDEIPDPITVFNLSDPSKLADNYEMCMNDIRSTMEKETDVKYTFVMGNEEVVVPVTPGEDFTKKGAYTIRLTDGDIHLDLVADKYQTWFRGIVTNDGRRYEVDEISPKIMKNSGTLHTTGMYPKLIDEDIGDLILGYQQLLSAFYTLARYGEGGRDSNNAKVSIAIFLVMFFEGPRLLPVHDLVKTVLLDQQSSAKVGEKNEGLINSWCNNCLSFYEEKGEATEVIISEETSAVVKNAAETFRIMCRSKWDTWRKKEAGQAQASSKHESEQPRDKSSSGSSRKGSKQLRGQSSSGSSKKGSKQARDQSSSGSSKKGGGRSK
ncbi:hypothetical protein ACP70R_014756 [Stipagrostis hirtigluma subsp. patula]